MVSNWHTANDSTVNNLYNQFKQAATNIQQFQMEWGTSSTSTTTTRQKKKEPDGPLDWLDGRVGEMRKQGREALAL